MKRLFPVAAAALFAVGCQDAQLVHDIDPPSLDWSDASSTPAGNPHFFFLPPVRPTPDAFNGDFNPYLTPEVTIHELPLGFDFTAPEGRVCDPSGAVQIAASLSPVTVNVANEEYATNLDTGPEDNIVSGRVYRACVRLHGSELAWRDLGPQDEPVGSSRDVAQDPIYGFNNGRNIPLSFRIELGAGCGLADNIDCTEAIFGVTAQTETCDAEKCGLATQDGSLSEPTLIRIELIQCPRDPTTGQITHLGVETDIPLFPGCLEITTPDNPTFAGFNPGHPAVAGACFDASNVRPGQEDLAQLLHARTNADGSVTVEALPQVYFPVPLDCDGFVEFASAGSSNPIIRFARRGWRAIEKVVGPWWNPPPLEAIDRGIGGGGLQSESPLVWGVPVQQERVMVDADGNVVDWTDPEPADIGETVFPAVRIWDSGDPTCDPAEPECHPRHPVEGATIRFATTGGGASLDYSHVTTTIDAFSGALKVVSNSDGIATVGWTLGGANPNTLDAIGVGIGCFSFDADGNGDPDCRIINGTPPPNPPSPDGTGPFGDNSVTRPRVKVDLATGVTSFAAVACVPSPGIQVDGDLGDANWATSHSIAFLANISGGATNATLRWFNDCENLYFALEVETANDKVNVFGLDFDENNDGFPALNDDVLVFDAAQAVPFADLHLSQKCLNSNGQSACGDPDGTNDGAGDFSQNMTPGMERTYYEISHPLKGSDADQDFQLDFGDYISFSATLRIGKGAQGDTQFPGFRTYCTISVVPGGGSSAISCAMP